MLAGGTASVTSSLDYLGWGERNQTVYVTEMPLTIIATRYGYERNEVKATAERKERASGSQERNQKQQQDRRTCGESEKITRGGGGMATLTGQRQFQRIKASVLVSMVTLRPVGGYQQSACRWQKTSRQRRNFRVVQLPAY